MTIVLIGPPGCGKGTQAKTLVDTMGMEHLSSGDLLRSAIAQGTALGKRVEAVLERGDLVDDETMVGVIAERIDRSRPAGGYIFDGFPRTVAQAEALDSMLAERGLKIDQVIQLTVDDDQLVSRITGRYTCAMCGEGYHDRFKQPAKDGICDNCGGTEFTRRDDDKEETVKARLGVYYELTAQLLPYYEGKGVLRTVDGMADIGEVTQAIQEVMKAT